MNKLYSRKYMLYLIFKEFSTQIHDLRIYLDSNQRVGFLQRFQ